LTGLVERNIVASILLTAGFSRVFASPCTLAIPVSELFRAVVAVPRADVENEEAKDKLRN